ncbi:flagellar basal body-associated FliL family protein [Desulforamulus aquiferis]|uniref:Flagellar protein FliL n=1 Tax=Desulforamulus aquiferis TaxID=1397668 RepID=A0AAW7ZF13_9FIRM|nr:flagellar basal body-associated FliL family protein [Desulforamulus aquiferis]MDO7788374.1 flagellar basal body-associated FliL family protein [Desulforamulus aquiferis]
MPASPQDTAPQVQKPKKLFTFKNVLITLLCSLVLAGTGLGGYIYFIGTDKADARTGPDPEKLISLNMGSLLVNLADPGGSNFMRLTPVLEYEKNKVNKKLPEELNRKKVVLQDCIIRTIRTKSLADVQPPDSIDKIANELKNEVNKNLEDGQIHRVYFAEYLTQ